MFRYNGAGFSHWTNMGGGSVDAEAIWGSVGTLMGHLLPPPKSNPVSPQQGGGPGHAKRPRTATKMLLSPCLGNKK